MRFIFHHTIFVLESVTYESPPSSSSYELEVDANNSEKIPLDYKIKVINIQREHPRWNLATIQNNGGAKLSRMDTLVRWRKDIENGGTVYDKYNLISKCTYERFVESRKLGKPVYTRTLKVWAMQTAMQFLSDDFYFRVSRSWLNDFKNKNRIRMRKITRYIKPTENRSMEEVINNANKFQAECSNLIPRYNLDFVINTDKSGCEYRMNT